MRILKWENEAINNSLLTIESIQGSGMGDSFIPQGVWDFRNQESRTTDITLFGRRGIPIQNS